MIFNGDISSNEWLYGKANRLLHSSFYTILYFSMAFLSLITFVWSLLSDCPTFFYTFLEMIVNLSLICEVGLRIIAQRRVKLSLIQTFFDSFSNIFDVFVVIVSLATVSVVPQRCSSEREFEMAADNLLLVSRNSVQFVRVLLLAKK